MVLLGACGGIALYKVPLLVSRLRELGAAVHVVMTEAATRFVTPLTFQTVSDNPVHTDLFGAPQVWNVEQVALAERADLLVVAPATADIIGKAAAGVADDFLTTTLLAVTSPVLCGDLKGLKVVVSAGPTREPLDPVRFISNPSSGRMGFALAAEARRRGAEVVLVTGPAELRPPDEVAVVRATTATEMREAVLREAGGADVVVMAAAPADWAPARPAPRKVRKAEADLNLDLVLTPDILAELGHVWRAGGAGRTPRVLVGFAAETHDLLQSAGAKLKAKNADLIVANQVADAADSGFGAETNRVTILGRDGSVEELPLQSKTEVARAVFDRVTQLLREGGERDARPRGDDAARRG